jgi:hypothetical protein
MCWMITLGVIAAILIQGVLPLFNLEFSVFNIQYSIFNLLVTGDGLMQDVIERVPRAPAQPVQQPSLLLWKSLANAVQRL